MTRSARAPVYGRWAIWMRVIGKVSSIWLIRFSSSTSRLAVPSSAPGRAARAGAASLQALPLPLSSGSAGTTGVALGEAVEAITRAAADIGMPELVIGTFQGNAQAFQSSLASEPALIAAALVVVYIILGMLYESFIHPLTILSTLPSAGVGALLALNLGHMDLSVIGIIGIILLIGIVKKNGIMLVDFAIVAERERNMPPVAAIREACLLRGGRAGASFARGRPGDAAVSAATVRGRAI